MSNNTNVDSVREEIAKLEAKRATLKKRLASVENKILDEQKKLTVVCCWCGSSHEIGSVEYIQTYWYERPWGCTGGDVWHAGEGQYDCPSCGKNNRLYKNKEIELLKGCFRSVRKKYER